MAVPKRRTSKSKKLKRRTHQKLILPNLSECSNCGEMRKNHHVCPSCGFYGGNEVISK